MYRITTLICLLWLLQGCVKQTSWEPKDELTRMLIVDAIITDEVKVHQIKLTYPVSQLNQAPEPVAGAGVLISNEDSTWQLIESPVHSGIYNTPPFFFARLPKTYTLLISVEGKVYTAKTTMTPGAVFGELRYARNKDNNLYYVDWVANAFSAEKAAMWELLLDWTKVPGYEQLDSLENHARLLFYTLPTLDVSEVFAPMMESVFFPSGTIITERRYSLIPQHAEFIREMLLETNWTGGLFPVAPANVGTNMSNGAFGYFGACAVTELSLTVIP
ncbi:MAG: hypothetical protein Q8M08_11015 [Bacteroidales bacterium]|nr:hypothetical protein [Bacteroidales bacterium]